MTERSALTDLAKQVAQDHPSQGLGELPASWASISELGLSLVGTPVERGGAGGAFGDLAAFVDGLAQHGVGGPLATTSIANWVASGVRAPDPTAVVALALHGDAAVANDSLTGRLTGVSWARHACALVYLDSSGSWLVDLGQAGVEVLPSDDLASESRDTVVLTHAAAKALPDAPPRAQVESRLALLTTHALHGALTGAYELTRAYVAAREQFGQPLVKLPAVATRLALFKTSLLQLRAAMARAEVLFDAGPDELVSMAAVMAARALAGNHAGPCARTAHQLHGAMGVTQEYPLHELTRRLWAWRDADGSTADWSRRLGELVLDVAEFEVWDELTGHVEMATASHPPRREHV